MKKEKWYMKSHTIVAAIALLLSIPCISTVTYKKNLITSTKIYPKRHQYYYDRKNYTIIRGIPENIKLSHQIGNKKCTILLEKYLELQFDHGKPSFAKIKRPAFHQNAKEPRSSVAPTYSINNLTTDILEKHIFKLFDRRDIQAYACTNTHCYQMTKKVLGNIKTVDRILKSLLNKKESSKKSSVKMLLNVMPLFKNNKDVINNFKKILLLNRCHDSFLSVAIQSKDRAIVNFLTSIQTNATERKRAKNLIKNKIKKAFSKEKITHVDFLSKTELGGTILEEKKNSWLRSFCKPRSLICKSHSSKYEGAKYLIKNYGANVYSFDDFFYLPSESQFLAVLLRNFINFSSFEVPYSNLKKWDDKKQAKKLVDIYKKTNSFYQKLKKYIPYFLAKYCVKPLKTIMGSAPLFAICYVLSMSTCYAYKKLKTACQTLRGNHSKKEKKLDLFQRIWTLSTYFCKIP